MIHSEPEPWCAQPLPDDEQADLRHAYDTGWLTLLAHVTELADAYRAQGLVMGDLAHDGTLRAQAEAEAEADDEYEFHQCPHEVIRATQVERIRSLADDMLASEDRTWISTCGDRIRDALDGPQ